METSHESRSPRSVEQHLRERVDELEREVARLRNSRRRPSHQALWIALGLLALVLGAVFYAGYTPHARVSSEVERQQRQNSFAALSVRVATVRRAATETVLHLPGTIQAITEAPLLARADGYVKRRVADIGDRVGPGQLLAEIEAPELDDQARQVAAALEQAKAALEQARANRRQGESNAELARVTATRWSHLRQRGVVSRQENDQQQAHYQAQTASLAALDKAVEAASSNVSAAEASLARVEKLRGYLRVRAPFAGLVTMRNIDVGALVTAGNTLLYRVADTATLRTFLNVPQAYADTIHAGEEASLALPDHRDSLYPGRVVRMAGALDPATRTMLVEVHAANRDGALLPGMYVEVTLAAQRAAPPLVVDADTLATRADGSWIFLVTSERTVRGRKVQVGRDYGAEIEILAGVAEGDTVVVNPNDSVRDGVRVEPVSDRDGSGSGAPAAEGH